MKLRGFRIELGEIETVLAEHPAVAAAACLLRAEGDGPERLVAYVAPAGAAPGRASCAPSCASACPSSCCRPPTSLWTPFP